MLVPRTAKRLYQFGPFRLDAGARLLARDGQAVPLSAKAFDILLVLVENAGQPVEKESLIRAVWPDTFVEESNLTHHVAALRKALGEAPDGRSYIETLPKRGYQFVGHLTVGWLESTGAPQAVPVEPAPVRRRRPAVAGALVIAGTGLAVLASYLFLRPSASKPPGNMTFTQLTDWPGQELYPSLFPDGNAFVYARRAAGNWDIYFQRVGGKNPVNLTGDSTSDDSQPAVSPDGQLVAFRSERDAGGIFVMGASGESVRRLSDSGYNPAWSPDGREVVFSTATFERPDARLGFRSGLWVADVATGRKRLVSARIDDAAQPHWSPHGHRIAYWGLRQRWQRDIWTVAARGDGQPMLVTDDAYLDWNPVWSADGHYLYFSSERSGSVNLWRVRIDEESGKLLGLPEPATTPSPYSGYISFSRDGRRMAYVQQVRSSNLMKVRFDPLSEKATGQPTPVTQGSREAHYPDLSPDGRRLVFFTFGQQEDLYIVGADGSDLRQLTNDSYKDRGPRWSPDGDQIAFMSNRSGKFEVWSIHPDGSGLRQLTWYPDRTVNSPFWSPDGAHLGATPGGLNSFLIEVAAPWNAQAARALPPLPEPDHWFLGKSWSSDGRRLAGDRMAGGGSVSGISVYSVETQQYHRLTDFGSCPHWLSDSRRLLFVHQGKLYLIDTGSRKVREVLSVAPHEIRPYNFSLSHDDRLIYFIAEDSEADVWLTNLP